MNKLVFLLTALIVLPSVAQAQKNLIQGGIKGVDDATYYGQKVTGTNILFLLDMSTGGPNSERLKPELKSLLKQLGPANPCILSLIGFGKGIVSKTIGVQLKTPNAINYLTREIDQLGAGGSSRDFERAWIEGLRVAKKNNIDVIYFVSAGKAKTPVPIIKEWQAKYRQNKLVINTIAIGAESELLEEIAKIGNGEYKCVP